MFNDKSLKMNIHHLATKKLFCGKMLFLWEINPSQRSALNYILQEGYTPEAFISFNVNPDLRKAWGVNVYHPEYLKNIGKNDLILCISKYEYNMHKRYILDYLCLSNQQVYVDYQEPSIIYTKFLMAKKLVLHFGYHLKYKIHHTGLQINLMLNPIRGFIVYKKLRNIYGVDIPFIFFNYPGSGDAYLSSSIINEYIKNNKISDFIAIATGRVSKIILETYGYKNIHELTDSESIYLRHFVYFIGAEKLNIKLVIQLANHLDITTRLAGIKLNLLDMYVYKIFNYNTCPELKHPKTDIDQTVIQSLFEEKNLCKNKTVIISPYANSEVGFSPVFWREIVDLLRKTGYDVATMCHGTEAPIKGTVPIDFSLKIANSVLEYAGYFIGVRSGFCDVTIKSDCKKIILYPENIYGLNHPYYKVPLSHINFHSIFEWASFQRMGINVNAVEIRCNYHYTKRIGEIIKNKFGE